MKALKLTFVAALASFIFSSTATHAQKLYLGIKAGVNMDQTNGDYLNSEFKGHFMGGGYVGFKFAMVRIQGELLFTQSSISTGNNFTDAFGNYVNNSANALSNGTFKTSELCIPITVGVNIVPKLLWIEAGPQYSGVVSTSDPDDFLHDAGDVIKKGYMSGVVGASVNLPFNLNAGARYIFGLTDRNNTNVEDTWKTSQIQLHVGLTLM